MTTQWESNGCVTGYHANYAAYLSNNSACIPSGGTSSLTSSNTYDSPICSAMIRSVQYTVTHDQTMVGAITSIAAAVVVSDVPLIGAGGSSYGLGDVDTLVLLQSYGIGFSDAGRGAGGRSTTHGNLVNRTRSGNPGYLMGTPVLFGRKSGAVGTSFIEESTRGLTIPTTVNTATTLGRTTAAAACPTASSWSTMPQTNVLFGEDTISGCTLSLTRYTHSVVGRGV